MITSTVLAVFFVPVFYVAIQGLIELISGPPRKPGDEPTKEVAPAYTPAHGVPAIGNGAAPHEKTAPAAS